jgi:flavin reductase (DIM6/NTAB) family NADH-FMN oxidoreductase RutF
MLIICLGLSVLALPLTADAREGATDVFTDRFIAIAPEDINDNVFKLFGQDWSLLTAGPIPGHNSMTTSFGGVGILFDKPAVWSFLRANRYTLEIILKTHTYTMCFFPDQYRPELLLLGSKSGRSSNKMQESKLTPLITPDGNSAYAEARLILECRLLEVTTVNPDDFFSETERKFILEAYKEAKQYHKIVIGEITKVWRQK